MSLSQSSSSLKTNRIFTWHSETAATECRCRLRIFQISFDKTIVIVSELPDNPGRTITDEALTLIHLVCYKFQLSLTKIMWDEALTLIHLVCYKFQLSLTKIMWVEHYPSGYLKDDETYEQLLATPFSIQSHRISKKILESLLDLSL